VAVAASPVASPVATPTSENAASTTAGDAAGQIDLLVRTIAACQSERRVKTLTHLVSEGFLGDVYAGGGKITAQEFIAFGRMLPDLPVSIVSVTDVRVDEDGHATAEVVSTIGNQMVRARWSFAFREESTGDDTGDVGPVGVWIATGVSALPVQLPDGATTLEVKIAKNAYDPDALDADHGAVVINTKNTDGVDHELLVVSLAKGLTTRDLLTAPGPSLPDGVTVIGQLTVPANGTATMVLVNLERGDYAIVDLLPSSDGAPYLAHGMEATLTVH
jgi:hypothetical protein